MIKMLKLKGFHFNKAVLFGMFFHEGVLYINHICITVVQENVTPHWNIYRKN